MLSLSACFTPTRPSSTQTQIYFPQRIKHREYRWAWWYWGDTRPVSQSFRVKKHFSASSIKLPSLSAVWVVYIIIFWKARHHSSHLHRLMFVALEATFTYIFWAMRTISKDYGMAHICLWDRNTLEDDGLCSHSPCTSTISSGTSSVGSSIPVCLRILYSIKLYQLSYISSVNYIRL
jgi:hypothetical protein